MSNLQVWPDFVLLTKEKTLIIENFYILCEEKQLEQYIETPLGIFLFNPSVKDKFYYNEGIKFTNKYFLYGS